MSPWTLDGTFRARSQWPLPPEEGMTGTAYEAADNQTPALDELIAWRADEAYQTGFWKSINGQDDDIEPKWYAQERAWCGRYPDRPPNRRCRCGIHACTHLGDLEVIARACEIGFRRQFGPDRPAWPCVTARRVLLLGDVIPSLGKLAPGHRLRARDGFIDPPSTFRGHRCRLVGPILIDCLDVDTTRVLSRLFGCEVRQLPRPMSRVLRDHLGDGAEWWHDFPGFDVGDDTSGDMLI